MTFRTTLLTATMLALPLAANAAPPISGLYIGAGAGVNFLGSQNTSEQYTTIATSASVSTNVTTNAGPVVVLSLGWGFGNGLRAEIEGSWRNNSVSNITSSDGFWAGGSGHESKVGVMGNVLYDFDISPMVTPYIGAGVGYQRVDWHMTVTNPTNGPAGLTNNQGSFAYQGIVGAAFPIDAVPGLSLTAEYRYMGLAGTRTAPLTNPSLKVVGETSDTFATNSDSNHSILIGLRYAFGAPPPPAPQPPVVVPPARSYLVFFDWDKATLTDRARGIIRDAAANAQKVAYTQIAVDGNADTSGSHVYNQGLSLRRAQAVAAELVRDGVPKGAIAITANGDTHLLVPTGPGVREPQNRRVEIVIK